MLGPLEREIVAALMTLKSGNTREIMEELRNRRVKVAYTTVATILDRMYHKKLVGRRQEPYKGADRYVYVYRDIEKAYIDSFLHDLMRAFGEHGVVHLAERIEEMSPEDLRRLREQLKV